LATSLSGPITVAGQDVNTSSVVQQASLGVYAETPDGRGYRYALIGATSTVPGKVYVSSAWDSTNQAPVGGLAVAAAAIGATQVTLTGSLTLAANLLAGGYLATNITPGQGYIYQIKGNTAVSSATGCVITLADPLVVALTTSSKVVAVAHPYSSAIVSPGGASTGAPIGVASSIITNAQYGWLQTFGPAVVLAGVATSISLPGVPVTASASTAGSVIVGTAILPALGWAMQLMTATEYNLVFLTIH
jgi:hypothetical protein